MLNFFTHENHRESFIHCIFFSTQAIGKFIDGSGIPKLMTDCGLIAEGSLNGLLTGKHFNRCKKLHSIAALSIKKLHFNAFLVKYARDEHVEKLDESEIFNILQADSHNPDDATLFLLADVLRKYEIFTDQTLKGDHGCNAKFVMMYVRFIDYYLTFERAIRTSDLELYIYALFRMTSLFFTFNHQNYARWSTRYLDELINIDEKYPGLRSEFANGALSVRRTDANFCRTPIDITLEQTVNANAANKLTGITSFTNSINARQKWSQTHVVRAAIRTHFMEKLNFHTHHPENDRKCRIFDSQQKKFTEEITNNINPFDNIDQSKLFNLTSGKSALPETTEFLMDVELKGKQQMQKFITESKSVGRFIQPLNRNIIRNFASEIKSCKNSQKNQVNSMRIERDVLGRSLCLAMKNTVDIRNILTYPLNDVPYSLAHYEDSLQPKVQKGELILLLSTGDADIENEVNHSPAIDVEIIDGFYLLNRLHESPSKYGQFAMYLLRQICKSEAREIHVMFDKCETSSIKDVHVTIRNALYGDSPEYKIKGPNQERKGEIKKYLSNDNFTEELVAFLIKHWTECKQEVSSHLNEKRVFVSYGNKCYLFMDSDDVEMGHVSQTFANNHIEIETRMMLHIQKARAKNILVRTYNSDTVLVYLLYHMQFFNSEKEIFLETCESLTTANLTKRVNVSKIFNLHTSEFISALPGWYAFTGCFYEPSFFRKGRKSCMKLLKNTIIFQEAFSHLGSSLKVTEQITESQSDQSIEKFTCKLYGSKCCSINEARATAFEKTYGTSSQIDFKKKGK